MMRTHFALTYSNAIFSQEPSYINIHFSISITKYFFFNFTDDICQYFGVKIAMYFAWLGMYTKWLIAPAVLGIITFFLSNRGEVTRDWCILFFNIFNIVWATLFLEAWKRKSAELAYKWGTMDMPSDALKEPRPLFRVCFS